MIGRGGETAGQTRETATCGGADAATGQAPTHAAHTDAGISRRGLFGGVLAGGAGLAAGGALGGAAVAATQGARGSGATLAYPFAGEHQQGIVTPTQDRLHFAAFDVRRGADRGDLIRLLTAWSYAASRLTQGLDASASGATGGDLDAPPDDTGEAIGLPPAGLTITFGFGSSLFTDDRGGDRFGILDRRPAALQPLPRFAGDALKAELSGGDLCIQACANDPQVAVHAIRNLTRIAVGTATLRWSQLGFGRTSSTSTTQTTERNLFGFKDGTANLKAENREDIARHVWVGDEGPAWMRGGTFLVARRIRMLIEMWDHTSLREQEATIGRDKREGAPLGEHGEFDAPDFAQTGPDGAPLIHEQAHVRLAHPDHNGGAKLLRRGFNFVDGNDELGRLNAGLFFLSFQRDPQAFITVQRSLATDKLNEYISHVGSAVFAVPPGAREQGWVGQQLFEG